MNAAIANCALFPDGVESDRSDEEMETESGVKEGDMGCYNSTGYA